MLASLIITLILLVAIMGAIVLGNAPPSPRTLYGLGCLILLTTIGITLREDAAGFAIMSVIIIATGCLAWHCIQGPPPVLRFDAAMSCNRPAEPAEPVESEPVESEPVESEPVESEPVESEPVEPAPANVGTYLDHGGRFSVLTGGGPKQFKGVLFLAFGGDTPAEVAETLLTGGQIKTAKVVDRVSLPGEWKQAFLACGY